MNYKSLLVLLLTTILVFPPFLFAQEAPSELVLLTNNDVIEMVKAGLDTEIIITKIKNSPVDFDVSTKGLVDLKNAGVPSKIVSVMIERPKGPVPLNPRSDINQSQTTNTVVKSLPNINSIFIKAPTEVIRATAEDVIIKMQGPTINPNGIGYDAVLIIGIDCGQQTLSYWTGANYCTCEGSMVLESGGMRIWAATDTERAANSAKSSRIMAERMTIKFVTAWKESKQPGIKQ